MRQYVLRTVLTFSASAAGAYLLQGWLGSVTPAAVHFAFIAAVALILAAVDGYIATQIGGISFDDTAVRPAVAERLKDALSKQRRNVAIDGALLALVSAVGFSFANTAEAVSTVRGEQLLFAAIVGIGVVVADCAIRVLRRLETVRRLDSDVRQAVRQLREERARAELRAKQEGLSAFLTPAPPDSPL